jgi:hypothetical protein
MEDVDNYFEVIEHDPLTRRKTVHCGRAPAMVFPQSCFNFIGDRFELRFRGCGADHEEICEAGDSCEVENDNVFGFLIRSELGAGRG